MMLPVLRSLRRRPAFAAAAILTVALGIGANTALFSVIYAVLLRPLPFRDPGRLVQIWETHPALPQLQATAPDLRDWQAAAHSFESIAAHTLSAMNNATLLGQGDPAAVHAAMASASLFPTMGIRTLAGRAISDADERSRSQVAMLSENLWRQKFGGDPAVIGRQIRLDGQSMRVIGVVPRQQAFPEWADLWIPLSLMEDQLQSRRKYHPLEVIARLRPGVTPEQAGMEMRAIAQGISRAHPDTNAMIGAMVVPLVSQVTGGVRPSLLLAWAAVGLVLLIACANLAHLFLARVIERRQELEVREALGAGTGHLIRQLLGESLLVAAIGGLLGIASAIWAGQLVRTLGASQIPRLQDSAFEGAAWLFAAAISLAAGVLFGLPACWQVLRRRNRLAGGGRGVALGQSRLSAALMMAEVAMAVLVLSGAALLTRNFAALLNQDPGFRAGQVWSIPNLSVGHPGDTNGEFLRSRLLPALRAVPGVVDAAAVNAAPMSLGATEHSRFATRFGVEGRTYQSGSFPVAQTRWISPEYFRVMGIPLKRGRWLDESDRTHPRIVVNETLARRFYPGQDPVGKRLLLGVMDPQQSLLEIVGVVGDVREFGLDQEVEPALYSISSGGPILTLLVNVGRASRTALSDREIREAIHAVDPEIAVTRVQPLWQNVADSLARRRFALVLLAVFGGLAAFLTASGMYGLFTQSVNARVRDFGVRAAVGAAPRELIWMILKEAASLTLPGMILGVALALAFGRVMKALVYRLSPADPLSIASAAVSIVLLTFVSAWLPARRAAAVDPALALRSE